MISFKKTKSSFSLGKIPCQINACLHEKNSKVFDVSKRLFWVDNLPIKEDLQRILRTIILHCDAEGRYFNSDLKIISSESEFSLLKTWLIIRNLKKLHLITFDRKARFCCLHTQSSVQKVVKKALMAGWLHAL